jgi:hypothetical protein
VQIQELHAFQPGFLPPGLQIIRLLAAQIGEGEWAAACMVGGVAGFGAGVGLGYAGTKIGEAACRSQSETIRVAADRIADFLGLTKACFVAGTPLEGEFGAKPAEAFQSYEEHGDACDRIISRSEHDPAGLLTVRRVLRMFVRHAEVVYLHAAGRVIGTTREHPFYVKGQGWTPAFALRLGDEVALMDGGWLRIDGVADSGRRATVYNLEVEGDHTYFVGCDEWGFSVWAHNASREYYNVLMKSGVDREPARDAAALIRVGDVEGGKAILRAALNNGKRKPHVIERKIDRALAQLDSLTRPSEWRAGFVEEVEARMPRTTDDKPMIHDLVDGKVVLRERQPGEYGEIGHIEGMEHRTLVRDNAGMTQTEFNNLLHNNPEWFRIETRRLAASHKGEAQ